MCYSNYKIARDKNFNLELYKKEYSKIIRNLLKNTNKDINLLEELKYINLYSDLIEASKKDAYILYKIYKEDYYYNIKNYKIDDEKKEKALKDLKLVKNFILLYIKI